MASIVVIGATGHIGSYLVPRLVRAGHDVIALSRGVHGPYHPDPAWDRARMETCDREAEDAAGTFGERVAALGADVVVDLICFTPDSARQLVDALRPGNPRLVMCGTIWVHGEVGTVPVTEDDAKHPFGTYGIDKLAIEELLAEETRGGGLPTVVLHPGHISGPGWNVINPLGNLDPRVWTWLANGAPVPVPDQGLGVLHHIHADDLAQAFEAACFSETALGENFHIVTAQSMNLRGLCRAVAGWFGRAANLEDVSWAEFRERVGDQHADVTHDHVRRSITASIDKARTALGYEPRYTTEAALLESVRWLAEHGRVDLGGAELPPPAA